MKGISNIMFRLSLLLLLFNFHIAPSYGLETAIVSSKHVEPDFSHQFRRIGFSDGLPSLKINDIYQQSNGYIWISTAEGLSRYDGNEFKHFIHEGEKANSLTNNFISSVIEDANGYLWAITEHGLNRLSPDGTIKRYYHDPKSICSLSSSWLITAFIDEQQQLWLGTGSGLSRYIEEKDCFENYFIYEDGAKDRVKNAVFSIAQGANGTIYVGSDLGFFKVDEKQKQLITPEYKPSDSPFYYGNYVNSIKRVSDELLLLGTEKTGLLFYNTNTLQLSPVIEVNEYLKTLNQAAIRDTLLHSSGEIWLATNSGVIIFRLDSLKIRHLTNNRYNRYSIPTDFINQITEDKSGSVWLSTNTGVAFYSPFSKHAQVYRSLPNLEGLASDMVYSVRMTEDEDIWVATQDGANIINSSLNSIVSITPPMLNHKMMGSSPYTIDFDKNNRTIIALEDGIQILDSDGKQLAFYSNKAGNKWGLPLGPYFNVAADPRGGVWVGGFMGTGVFHFDFTPGGIKQFLHQDDNIYTADGNFTYKMLLCHEGDVWLATTGGIFRIDGKTFKTHYYRVGKDQQLNRVTDIVEDLNGQLWITTSGNGLVKVSKGKAFPTQVEFEYFNEQMGLNESVLKSIAIDAENQLWFSGKNLIYRFNQQENTLVSFPSLIVDDEITFTEAAMSILGKNLLIGSSKGLVRVDLAGLGVNPLLPPMLVTKFIAGEEDIYLGQSHNNAVELELPFEQNNIEITFASLDYTRPELNQYRYRMKGLDDKWVYQQSAKSARFNNLSSGHYTFQVEGTNSDGLWSGNRANISFSIMRPFWHFGLFLLAIFSLFLIGLNIVLRKQQIKALYKRANFDGLTGLPNREHFNNEARSLMKEGNHLALAFIDMDYFKDINDNFGHAVGDTFIKRVGERLSANVRANDIVARISGDEFAILFYIKHDKEEGLKLASRILKEINKGFQIDQHWIKGSASIGVASFPEDTDRFSQLMKNADTAMYVAKKKGRNNVCLYKNELSQQLLESKKLDLEMRKGLVDEQFTLHYQPKVSCIDSKIVSLEALIRWQHPNKGLMSPVDFIPLAEKTGFIIELGKWVLNTACQQAGIWWDLRLLSKPISVNLSALQLVQGDIIKFVEDALESSGLPANMLELEITESLLINDLGNAKRVLGKLHSMGVSIALDDFGTGFSSLSYLTDLPISTLKIDRKFIGMIGDNIKNTAILANIFSLGNDLQLNIVAEGIEDENQLKFVKSNRCHLIQGYYFSPPVDSTTASKMLMEQTFEEPNKVETQPVDDIETSLV